MTDDEILEVVKAHKEGKKIQWSHTSKHNWYDFTAQPVWDFVQFIYRVAPEPRKPREFIVNLYSDGSISSTWARKEVQSEQICVREVIHD